MMSRREVEQYKLTKCRRKQPSLDQVSKRFNHEAGENQSNIVYRMGLLGSVIVHGKNEIWKCDAGQKRLGIKCWHKWAAFAKEG